MAIGALDANGVWIFGEDDPASPVSDLLNLGMDSVSDAVGDAKARLTTLEDERDAAWTAFTPAWGNISVGNGVTVGHHRKIGRTADVRAKLTWGSTTSCSGTQNLTLPFAAAAAAWAADYMASVGTVLMKDATNAGSRINGLAATYAAGAAVFFNANQVTSYTAATTVAATVPFTWAVGDVLTLNIRYETAA